MYKHYMRNKFKFIAYTSIDTNIQIYFYYILGECTFNQVFQNT